MADGDTRAEVIGAIAKVKSIPAEEIGPETEFAEIHVDSLDAIEILFELEERFDLSVPDEAVQGMERVGQVIEAVERALAERAEAAPD
ncbi:MAG: acyl carrier protein [Thermoanaerobaculia bacterium]|nr:acyl carrier protein [Thermoanaerobaculia bacterium]